MISSIRKSLSNDIPSSANESMITGEGNEIDMIPVDQKEASDSTHTEDVISYKVQANDTLMSVAAHFDTTPSELTKTNRLSTRFLFPGQVLLVPNKNGSNENACGVEKVECEEKADIKETQMESISAERPPFTRTPAHTSLTSIDNDHSLDSDCLQKFLKIHVRHITDGQGVVAGVLLVTPNAVMFDPNVSDPLVIERGSESYGVIAPMEFVVNVALFYDISHMKVKNSNLPRSEYPKPEIYRSLSGVQSIPSVDCIEEETGEISPKNRTCPIAVIETEDSPSKETTFVELDEKDSDNEFSESCDGNTRGNSAFPKAFEQELLIIPVTSESSEKSDVNQHSPVDQNSVTVPQNENANSVTTSHCQRSDDPSNLSTGDSENANTKTLLSLSSSLPPVNFHSVGNEKKRTTSLVSGSSSECEMPTVPEDKTCEPSAQETRKQKVLKRISYPLSWMESFGTESKECLSGILTHPQGSLSTSISANLSGSNSAVNEEHPEKANHGMFGNVFSISSVSNMLTRRTSSDSPRRPSGTHSATSSESLASPAADKHQGKEGSKFGLKSMVSMEDMPDLFASFDRKLRSSHEKELIPKPISSDDESPLFLCLRMGCPINQPIKRSTPIMSYGKKLMRPEYWFSIPKRRVEDLYQFFQLWSKDIYGHPDSEAIRKRGFALLEDDFEIINESSVDGSTRKGGMDAADELKEITKESWEKLKSPYVKLYSKMKTQMTFSLELENTEVPVMSEELRRALYSSNSLASLDLEMFLPEIIGKSDVIDDIVRKNMYRKLPARVQGYNWQLLFISSAHGFSLKSLYRKMLDIDSSILLFIEDTDKNVFGAFLPCPLRVSDSFYGTGESFLFTCAPEFQVYPWTGENMFFVKGNNESLYIGGGEGNFGLWLDGDLYKGRSQSCKTFGNPALCSSEDFIIKTIECWYFV